MARFQARQFREGGDVVTRVGDVPVRDSNDLSSAVERYRPGEKVEVQVWREGKARELEVTLGERPLAAPQPG